MDHEDDIFDTSQLQFNGDFDSQVQEVLQYIRLSRQEVENLQCLFNDVHGVLQNMWPGCQVHAFGSIVTGLGIKSSDVDCYISLPPWLQNPGETYVGTAKAALKRHPNIFKELFAIQGAKVPILKFYHAPTRRYCDISFKSPSGVENTKLLAYLLALDSRVLPLAIIIKYWSKVHNLTGTNLLPNYALLMLIIFYLQQKAILPPIYHLQRNTERYVDNWNVAFQDVIHVSGNSESLYMLLGGFFEFYSEFKYDLFIICPFLGRTVKKELFKNVQNVPPDFQLYQTNVKKKLCQPLRINSIVCIQDPFEHNKNCSVALYPKLMHKMMTVIKKCANIFATEKSENFLKGILCSGLKQQPIANKNRAVPHGISKFKPNINKSKFKKNIQNVVNDSRNKNQFRNNIKFRNDNS